MKKIIVGTLILAGLFSFTIFGNADGVVAALKTGNANAVAKYFDDNVRIAIGSESASYDAAKAAKVLGSFLQNKNVTGFSVTHSVERDKVSICIGDMSTSAGVYRTTIQLRNKDGKNLVQELKFEK